MGTHRFVDLGPDSGHRVQRRHRVLEDHRDVVAAELTDILVIHLDHVLVLEQDAPRDDPAGVGHQSQDGKGGDRLPRARLPDDADRFPAADIEADPVHRMDNSPGGEELRTQVLDPQQRGCHPAYLRIRGSIASLNPSPMKLNDSIVTASARAGTSTWWG